MDVMNKKRKKKKSLVQVVKKKFKNNNSRTLGTRLDSDIHEYFLRVFQQSKQDFPDPEDKRIFIENVFSQTEGHEIEYSSNQLVSRVLEGFLPECSDSILERFLLAFEENLRPMCSHQFASHVLETLLKISSQKVFKVLNDKVDTTKNVENTQTLEEVDVFLKFSIKVSKFLLNNIDEFILDTYANHVTRSAVSCLCGIFEESRTYKKSNNDELCLEKIIPKDFQSLLDQFAKWTLNSHMFTEYANNVLLSGLVQSVLLSLHSVGNKKYCDAISSKLIGLIYSPDIKNFDILQVLAYQQCVHLLNVMLSTSSQDVYDIIRSQCFTGRLKDMASSKTANYSLQKLIETCPNAEAFINLYDELSDHFEEIVKCGHTGVIFSLSKTCCRLSTREKSFVKEMMKCFGVEKSCDLIDNPVSGNFVLQLLSMGNPNKNPFNVNLHGCLVLQELLKFSKPDKVSKSVLNVETSMFLQILCDQKGSHLANAFMDSETVKDKYKSQFILKLQGSYLFLAMNKYGSFVFNALWKVADVDQKLFIVKELSCKVSVLLNSPSGRYISKNVALETYCHQPKEWENAQKRLIKSRQIFSDVIK